MITKEILLAEAKLYGWTESELAQLETYKEYSPKAVNTMEDRVERLKRLVYRKRAKGGITKVEPMTKEDMREQAELDGWSEADIEDMLKVVRLRVDLSKKFNLEERTKLNRSAKNLSVGNLLTPPDTPVNHYVRTPVKRERVEVKEKAAETGTETGIEITTPSPKKRGRPKGSKSKFPRFGQPTSREDNERKRKIKTNSNENALVLKQHPGGSKEEVLKKSGGTVIPSVVIPTARPTTIPTVLKNQPPVEVANSLVQIPVNILKKEDDTVKIHTEPPNQPAVRNRLNDQVLAVPQVHKQPVDATKPAYRVVFMEQPPKPVMPRLMPTPMKLNGGQDFMDAFNSFLNRRTKGK